MTENTRERTTQSVLTTAFLKDQLENAKKELDTIEQKLTSFRTSANGRLPEQVAQNGQTMNLLEQRVSNLNAQIGRVSQEKLLLEADLRSMKTQRASFTPSPETVAQKQKNEKLVQIDREIMQMEANLSTLREHYKDTYPDVRRLQSQLSSAKKMREQVLAEEEETAKEPASPTRRLDPMLEKEARQLDTAIERTEAQLKAKDVEAKNLNAEIANAEKGIRTIQSRIESTPVSEQQYADIIRDREVAKLKYDDLARNGPIPDRGGPGAETAG